MRKARSILVLFISALLIPCWAGAQEADPRYGISAGDVLEISVWKDESLSRELIVPPDGVISFPLIGDIQATGLTVTQLREAVSEKLSEYVPDVTLTVMLRSSTSLVAYVIGKVNNPGAFPINLETSVVQILSMAGGLNAFAAADDILIIRHKDGRMTKIPFSYEDIRNGEKLEQNILLERGDVVVVP